MKLPATWLLLCLVASATRAQLLLTPPDQPVAAVFGGGTRPLEVRWQNTTDGTVSEKISRRLAQTSSATTATFGDTPWKTLNLLPRQTVVESVPLEFPAVTTPAKFLVQWTGTSNQSLGLTTVMVYPTNLLGELKALFKDAELGVLDPNDELKPVLKQNGVPFLDLGERALEEFRGKLAVIGPFHSPVQMREGLVKSIRKIAAAGVAVVWLQPPSGRDEIMPSFYVVPGGKAAMVVAQADLAAHFSESPQSQLNLVHFCRLALNPQPFFMPNLAYQP